MFLSQCVSTTNSTLDIQRVSFVRTSHRRVPEAVRSDGTPVRWFWSDVPEQLLVGHGEAEPVFVAQQRRPVHFTLLLHFQQGVWFTVLWTLRVTALMKRREGRSRGAVKQDSSSSSQSTNQTNVVEMDHLNVTRLKSGVLHETTTKPQVEACRECSKLL